MGDDQGQRRMKEAAGRAAANYVTDGMRVGLGTGSTVHWTIVALGERQRRGEINISTTATSLATEQLARSVGLEVSSPDEIGSLDLAIDGADEVDPNFNLTKGGGGAHTREKLVAEMSSRFIVVVDETKMVEALGPFGTPLEVLPFAPRVVGARVQALGAARVITRDQRSDNDNLLCDAYFGVIADPDALATALERVPGLVEHGIFRSPIVERVVVADHGGRVRDLVNPQARTT